MGAVPIADEGLHPASDDIDWQESVYLAWRDAASGLGGNHRIGNEVNRATANLWCGVYHEDGTRFRHNGEDLPLTRLAEHGLSGGPQRLFHDGQQLRFALESPDCTIDFEVDDEAGPVTEAGENTFRGSAGATGTIFSNNFHTFCRVRGTVVLGGRTATVEGQAWRDHSWGVRRWNSFVSSRSFGGSLGSSLQFRYGSMVGANGSFHRQGALLRDGQPLPLAGTEMLVHLDDDSIRCPVAELRYRVAGGDDVHVRIETIGGMLGVTRERCGWESVGDVWVDGQGGGWGFLEVNNNPRNGREAPAFVLGEAMTNGLVVPAS